MCILEKQINTYFIKNENPQRICQGDLLSNLSISISSYSAEELKVVDITFPFVVVLSQDCDLMQYFDVKNRTKKDGVFNQYLSNVLIAPCYYKNDFKSGENLSFLNINQTSRSSDQMKLINQEREPRYHYIEADGELKIPELYIDFKVYYTVQPDDLFSSYKECYIATINALFRERITQRYTNYISRIGLPCLTTNAQ